MKRDTNDNLRKRVRSLETRLEVREEIIDLLMGLLKEKEIHIR